MTEFLHKLRKLAFYFSPGYLYRYFFLQLSGKEVIVSGRCRQCGSCCKELSLDIDGEWIKSEKNFERLKSRYPEYDRMEITGRDSSGNLTFQCTWLSEENMCKDHENRLEICDTFPNKELYIMGGKLPDGCGYKLQAGVPFNKVLEEKQ
ncbi:MAG: YkgJ family cysteine cluster protein [Nitrospinae bacterium]|nr:YkgJ family cysteine cluster protein [Nitrospinota bacterium]